MVPSVSTTATHGLSLSMVSASVIEIRANMSLMLTHKLKHINFKYLTT